MEESHVEGGNEKRADLQMLEKIYEEDNIDQAPIEIEKKYEVFFSIRKRADHFPYGSAYKNALFIH